MNVMSRFGAIVTIVALAIVSIGISSCEAITEAATVGVPITIELFPESINPTIPTEDVDCADMASFKDYQDNKDMIKSGEPKDAYFEIEELQNPTFNTAVAVFSFVRFQLEFDASYGDSKVYDLGTFTNVSLQSLLDGPVQVPITDDSRQAINKIVDGQEKFCVKAVYGAFNAPIGAASASYLKGKLSLTIDFKAEVL